MINAKRDQNNKTVGLGVSSVDNTTPLMMRVDSVTDYLLVEVSGSSITAVTGVHKIGQNNIPTCYGVSSVDNRTLVPIRTDSTGKLLVE